MKKQMDLPHILWFAGNGLYPVYESYIEKINSTGTYRMTLIYTKEAIKKYSKTLRKLSHE